MKTSEHKIKHQLPFAELPAYLRQLAGALENETDNIPEELKNLPEPMAKFEIKGRARNALWELKIKIKAEPAPEPAEPTDEAAAETAAPAKAKGKYKPLKKKMKSTFKNMGESLEVQKLPEPELMSAFLADSDRMLSFKGKKYGETHYPAYREACRLLAKAYEAKSLMGCISAYDSLNQLMKDCHKEYK
jgi:XXXCH domain-containing protein